METEINEIKWAPFLAGTGGNAPGIYKISPENEIIDIKQIEHSRSIYSLSFIKEKKLFGFGTRNKPGDVNGTVEIAEILEEGGYSTGQKVVRKFFAYSRYSIFAFQFFSDKIFLSGSIDGSIQIWDINKTKPFGIERAHNGMVVQISPVTDSIFASLGADSYLKFWDVKTGANLFSFPGSGEPPQIQSFIKFYSVPELGFIISHHTCGSIFVHDFSEGLKSNLAPFNGGKASTLSVAGDKIAVVDFAMPLVKLFSLETEKELYSFELNLMPWLVEFIDTEYLFLAFNGALPEIWDVSGNPRKVSVIQLNNIRAVARQNPVFSRDSSEVKKNLLRDNKIEKMKSLLALDNFENLTSELNKFAEEGLSVESMVILAEWSRKKNKPLWELKIRLAMCEELPLHPLSAVHYYALAELLLSLNEPAKALEYFKLARDCHPEFKDVDKKITHFEQFGAEKDINFVEFADSQKALQEIIKKLILKDNISGFYALKSVKEANNEIAKIILEPEEILKELNNGKWTVEEFYLDSNTTCKALVSKVELNGLNDFYYALLIKEIQGVKFYQHTILYSPSEFDVNPIEKFTESFKIVESREFQTLFEAVQKTVKQGIKNAFKSGFKSEF